MDVHRTCNSCKETKLLGDFFKHPKGKDGRLSVCKKCRLAYDKLRVQTWGKEKHKIVGKRFRDKLRAMVFAAYGNSCKCCGEARWEFLHLDHIHGGGARLRRRQTSSEYAIAKRDGYPKNKYRILCSNCNLSLGARGYCPHNRSFK